MKALARDERKPFYKRLLLAGMAATMVTLIFSLSSCVAFGPSGYGQDWSGYYPSYPGDNNGSTGPYLGDQYRPKQRDRQTNQIMPNRQYRPNGANKQNNRSSPQDNTARPQDNKARPQDNKARPQDNKADQKKKILLP
jgi:hypothetical protein